MLSSRLLAVVALAAVAVAPPSNLQVLRYSPMGEATPTAQITVTFDRPVAGSLDRTVDPGSILRTEPNVEGRLEWRDPVTLRLVPAKPLKPGSTYRVSIANRFEAMDGSRLAEPFQFSFEVSGPAVLGGLPVSAEEQPRFLGPQSTFDLVFSSELDASNPRNLAYLDFDKRCQGGGVVRLKITGQRAITEKDPWRIAKPEAGTGTARRPSAAGGQLARKCPAIRLRRRAGRTVGGRSRGNRSHFLRWAFHTYGPFRLDSALCSGGPFCPTGGVGVTFTTPVRGSEVQRRVQLLPAATFTIPDTSDESPTWYLETTLTPNTGYAAVVDTAIRDVFGQRLSGNPASGFRTTGFAPLVEYEYGRLTVERNGFRTLAVKYVNVDTLIVETAAVPESRILQYNRWNQDDSSNGASHGARDEAQGGCDGCKGSGADLRTEAAGLERRTCRCNDAAGGPGDQPAARQRLSRQHAARDCAGDRSRRPCANRSHRWCGVGDWYCGWEAEGRGYRRAV
jgi:hypothetical protein